MANEKDTMLPQLKSGALISIQLGSAFIAKIQECYLQHITGEEQQAQLQKLKDRNGNYESEPLTPWENQAMMYSSLLEAILKTAESEGLIEYVSMESMLGHMRPIPNDPMADSDQH